MSLADIDAVVADYGRAARSAASAPVLTAVELHCASGYLPGQFLASGSNQREDEYGGSLANRLRFIERVIDVLANVIGVARVGLRISTRQIATTTTLMQHPEATYAGLLQLAERVGIAWVHAIRIALDGH